MIAIVASILLACSTVHSHPQDVRTLLPGLTQDQIDALKDVFDRFGGGSQDLVPFCGHPNYDCVPFYLCEDGEIIDDGAGLIDIRTRPPRGNCLNPDYDGPSVCCKKSGMTPTPAPIDQCIYPQTCVRYRQCSSTGYVKRDESGAVELRDNDVTCWLRTGGVGVCCSPPLLDACPLGSRCVQLGQCLGTQYNIENQWTNLLEWIGVYQQCKRPGYDPGICCKRDLLNACPADSICVSNGQCRGNLYSFLDTWVNPSDNSGPYRECRRQGLDNGVCCKLPLLNTCPDDSVCVTQGTCQGTQYTFVNDWVPPSSYTGSYRRCRKAGGNGVCCKLPILNPCPDSSVCVAPGTCLGTQYSFLNEWVSPSRYSGSYRSCQRGIYGAGVCCKQPTLNSCPGSSVCVASGNCLGKQYSFLNEWVNPSDYSGSYRECKRPGYENGVCCELSALDSCPQGSSCVGNGQCRGTQYNTDNSWVDADEYTGAYHQCKRGRNDNGVCCKPSVLKSCPGNSACVGRGACEGKALLRNSNNFADYVRGGTTRYAVCERRNGRNNGVCCIESSDIIEQCPPYSKCVRKNACKSDVMIHDETFHPYDSPAYQDLFPSCRRNNGREGVCCMKAASHCGDSHYARSDTDDETDPNIDLRITTGNEYGESAAAFGEIPWQGIVFHSNYTFICGATLIRKRYALTAAHCVDGRIRAQDIKVRLGEYQVNAFDEPLPYEDFDVEKIIIHKDFQKRNVHNDIAILKLERPVKYRYHINRICLPKANAVAPDGKRCIVSGWGKESFHDGSYQTTLKKITVPVVERSRCQSLLRGTVLGKHFNLHHSFMCAGGEKDRDACKGDGGGPLMCFNETTGYYTLVGITSWGIECGIKNNPGVYLDVATFREWINKKTR